MDILGVSLNNRELAIALWWTLALLLALLSRAVRRSIKGMASATLHWKIICPFIAMLTWMVFGVLLLRALGLWTPALVKDTALWFFGVGVVLLINSASRADRRLFVKTVKGTVGVAVFLEFLVNLYAYPLAVELIAVPLLTALAIMKARLETSGDHRQLDRFVTTLLTIYGLVALAFSILKVMQQPAALLNLAELQAFMLPVALTLWAIPLAYAFALIARYEIAFFRLDSTIPDPELRRYAKRMLVRHCNFSLFGLNQWMDSGWPFQAQSVSDVELMFEDSK